MFFYSFWCFAVSESIFGALGDDRQCKLGVSIGERSDGGKRLRNEEEQEAKDTNKRAEVFSCSSSLRKLTSSAKGSE